MKSISVCLVCVHRSVTDSDAKLIILTSDGGRGSGRKLYQQIIFRESCMQVCVNYVLFCKQYSNYALSILQNKHLNIAVKINDYSSYDSHYIRIHVRCML